MSSSQQEIGIFTTDASLVVRSWDGWLARVTSVTAEAARGQSLTALFPGLEARGMLSRFQRVIEQGVVETLAPAFHHYLIPCPPQSPSKYFDKMQQRVTIAPLREDGRVVGTIVTIEDVTARLEGERVLYEKLASADEKTRLEGAQSLAERDALESTQPLVGALGDESWRVRRSAVGGIARHGGAEAVGALLRALRDEHKNPSILNSALQVLTLSGIDALTPLIEFLEDQDTDLRIYAALALGEQRDPRAAEALIRALDDGDANVRYHAIEALGRLRSAEAVDALLAVAESRDFYLAFPALDALRSIGDPRVAPRLLPLLEDEALRGPAADALGHLGDEEVVAPLASLLNTPGAPTRDIAQALAALYDRYEKLYGEGAYIADLARRAISATGAQNLLDALGEAAADELRSLALALGWLEGAAIESALTRLLGQPVARKEVVEALVRHGARVTDLLIEQLDCEDLETRQAAMIALGRIGDARAVPALVRALSEDGDLVISVAGALARIGDRRAFDALLGLVGHPNAAVRQAVIAALNSIGHPEMASRIVTLLGDTDPRVRESAVKIAGYFGYDQCVDLILERCEDKEEGVRRVAIEHLPYLEDERVVPTLVRALESGSPRVRASAAHAFAQIEPERAFPYLLEALGDPDPWVRYFSARSIGRHAYADALEPLARLSETDEAHQVRIAAMEALGEIGGAKAVAVLAPLVEAGDSDLERAALHALGVIKHEDALPLLTAALRSNEPSKRIDAIRALGKRGGAGAIGALQWVAAADADTSVAQEAVEAIARMGTPEAVAALIELMADPSRREACVAALAAQGEPQTEWIARGLAHPHAGVRRAVVDALARMKRPRASEFLSAALDDAEGSVRLAAVTAFGRLGSLRVERKMAALSRSDPDALVRSAAEKALRR